MIAGMPRLDASDFYMFRSYETGRSAYVTMVADYLPLQDPAGGPNFFNLETDGYYDINIDTTGSGTPTFAYRFRISNINQNISVNVDGKNVPIALANAAADHHGEQCGAERGSDLHGLARDLRQARQRDPGTEAEGN